MNVRGVGKIIGDLGIDTVILPFFLVFVIVFAILEKTKILGTEHNGESKRKLNLIIALIFALMFIGYLRLVLAVGNILPYAALALVIVIMIGLLLSSLGLDLSSMNKWWLKYVVGIVVLLIFGFSLDLIDQDIIISLLGNLASPVVIGIALFIGVIWFLTRENKKESPTSENKSSQDDRSKGNIISTRDDIENRGRKLKPGETDVLGKL